MVAGEGRTARRTWALGALAGVAVVALAAVGLLWLGGAALHFAPAVVLALPLVRRRYPGERLIARLSDARSPRPAPPFSPPCPRPLARLLPRGGQLLGSALAVRPPPVPALPR